MRDGAVEAYLVHTQKVGGSTPPPAIMETILNNYDVIGAVFILSAYIMLVGKVVNQYSLPYILLNIFGSVVILIKAVETDSMGVMLLQMLWIGVAIASLILRCVYLDVYGKDLG